MLCGGDLYVPDDPKLKNGYYMRPCVLGMILPIHGTAVFYVDVAEFLLEKAVFSITCFCTSMVWTGTGMGVLESAEAPRNCIQRNLCCWRV